MIKHTIKTNKGYTLLFAVLVSSVVLAIGISILTISRKEFLLSSSARESSSAFYSADTGLECAIYYDSYDYFSTSTDSLRLDGRNISCMGQSLTFNVNVDENGLGYVTMAMRTGGSIYSKACAVVNVTKSYVTIPLVGYIPRTTIESRGYNLGWDNSAGTCSTPSARRVERAILFKY